MVSFHDLHPGTRKVCERFLGRLRDRGVARVSLLVVPRWHGSTPCSEDAGFTAWLRDLADEGHDICLHGFFHHTETVGGRWWERAVGRFYTNQEGEFYQIDAATARDRIERGLRILSGSAGLPIYGFTPPAWLLSAAGHHALAQAGLHYTTTFGRVVLLQARTELRAPTLVYSCRSMWRRGVSRLWVPFWAWLHRTAPLLRIAAHPTDFAHQTVEASFYRHVERAMADGRVPVTYRDLLPAGVSPVAADPLAAA